MKNKYGHSSRTQTQNFTMATCWINFLQDSQSST